MQFFSCILHTGHTFSHCIASFLFLYHFLFDWHIEQFEDNVDEFANPKNSSTLSLFITEGVGDGATEGIGDGATEEVGVGATDGVAYIEGEMTGSVGVKAIVEVGDGDSDEEIV